MRYYGRGHVHNRNKSPPLFWYQCEVRNEHLKNFKKLIKLKITITNNKVCGVRAVNTSAIERKRLRGSRASGRRKQLAPYLPQKNSDIDMNLACLNCSKTQFKFF